MVPEQLPLLTLEPFPKLLMLPVFWGPFGPQCSYGLPIHEYVTYLATDVTLHRTTIKDAISLEAMWNSFERKSVNLLCHIGYITCTDPV